MDSFDTPLGKNSEVDSDTQKTQTNQSSNTGSTACRDNKTKLDGMPRVGSSVGLIESVTLEDIHEYEWADNDNDDKSEKESYIIQEILADYLKIKSFKRKYPDLERRTMDAYERSWLQEEGLVPAGRIDMGLTALKTDDVMKLLKQDYPEVHIALTDLFRRRKFEAAAEQQKRQYAAARIERGEARAEAARRRAVDSAADYNHQLIYERLTNRRCYWDLQTMQIHLPQRVYRLLDQQSFPNGAYPVAVIPGQFAEYYVPYTSQQLAHLPLSRALYPFPSRNHKTPPPLPTYLRFGSFKSTAESVDQSVVRSDNEKLWNSNTGVDGQETKFSNDTQRVLTYGQANGGSNFSHRSNAQVFTPEISADKKPVANLTTRRVGYARSKLSTELDSSIPLCAICGKPALIFIKCSQCKLIGHPICLDITDVMLPSVQSYAWSCIECKRCVECDDSEHEDQMMFCDRCDRGYHAFCVGLEHIPAGKWECSLCTSQSPNPKRSKLKKPNSVKKSKLNCKLTQISNGLDQVKPSGDIVTLKRPRGRPRLNRTIIPATSLSILPSISNVSNPVQSEMIAPKLLSPQIPQTNVQKSSLLLNTNPHLVNDSSVQNTLSSDRKDSAPLEIVIGNETFKTLVQSVSDKTASDYASENN